MQRRLLATLCLAGSLLACGTSRLVTAGGETKLGDELAAKIEQSIGLVEDPELASYVASIGARLVASSPSVRRALAYHFHLIDMKAPNAFALPGGHVYVSRGLLALLQSEEELANVLAHEIAHVSARHHLRHAVRQTSFAPLRIATGIGALATGLISPLLGEAVAALGSAPGALVLATYSRGQENQADELGQGFAAAAGWDPLAMSRVMKTLARDDTQRGGQPGRRSYFATHPTSPDRAETTALRARSLTVAAAPPIEADRRGFLRRLEGLLVGRSASEGVIAGNAYLHPVLDFHLTFPADWKIQQDDRTVRALAVEEDAMALLTLAGEGDDPEAIAKPFFDRTDLELEAGPTTRWTEEVIGTYAIARLERDGKHYRYALAWIAHAGHVYQISAGADLKTWPLRKPDLESVATSFRPLRSDDTPKLREGRLRIVDSGGRSLEERMPSDSAWSLAEAKVANALEEHTPRPPDGFFKIAPLERYVPPPEADSPPHGPRAGVVHPRSDFVGWATDFRPTSLE